LSSRWWWRARRQQSEYAGRACGLGRKLEREVIQARQSGLVEYGATDEVRQERDEIGNRAPAASSGARTDALKPARRRPVRIAQRRERRRSAASGGRLRQRRVPFRDDGLTFGGCRLESRAQPSVGTGDGQLDSVSVAGTAGADTIVATSVGAETIVSGLAAEVHIQGADAGLDQLQINAGAGNDTITGSSGNDLLIGGTGNDVAFMGAGDDTFVWNPGEASDVVEGEAGTDTMLFNGNSANETVDISANGDRVLFTRAPGSVTMDNHGVETIDFNAKEGADKITVHDLSGTDAKTVNIDLAGAGGGTGDGSNDVIVIEGTGGSDAITLSLQEGALVVDGLAARIVIANFEAGDQIQVLGLGGNDFIDAASTSMSLYLNGGAGNDSIGGGSGHDQIWGGAGDDQLFGGAGDDYVVGGTGTDLLDGGAGTNTLIQ